MRLFILLALLPTLAADAAPRRTLRSADNLRLVFLDADDRAPVRQGAFGDALLDVGVMRAGACTGRDCMRTVVRRRFRIRVDGGARSTRFVRVRAFLQADLPGQRVRIDGRILTSTPQLVDASAPLRVAIVHTLDVEIAASEPEGVIVQTISWLVEDLP